MKYVPSSSINGQHMTDGGIAYVDGGGSDSGNIPPLLRCFVRAAVHERPESGAASCRCRSEHRPKLW